MIDTKPKPYRERKKEKKKKKKRTNPVFVKVIQVVELNPAYSEPSTTGQVFDNTRVKMDEEKEKKMLNKIHKEMKSVKE